MSTLLNKVIEEFDSLEYEEKEVFQEIVNKAMIEAARMQIKKNADKAMVDYKAGKLKSFDNVDDLMASLNAE